MTTLCRSALPAAATPRDGPPAPVAADSTARSCSAAATPPAASRAARAHGRSSLCARHAGLAERTGQKIVIQRQLPDLGVKLLHVHHRRRGARTGSAERSVGIEMAMKG